jgi:hypothetical protein
VVLAAGNNGDEEALSHLMSFFYPELRRIACAILDRQ